MELTRFVPARSRLTAAVAVGAMALTLAGLHAPGAGAASQQPPANQQPPVCQSFTVADAQGVATGPVAGEVQSAPITGAQAGTQSGGAPQAATGQAGQPGAGADVAPNAPETVSCVIDAAGVPNNVCVVTNPGVPGQAGTFSTEAGTTGQDEAIVGSAQPGAGQQTAPDQVPAGGQVQSGGVAPAGNQVLNPNEQATATGGTASTQGAQGTQDSVAAAGQAGAQAGGVSTAQPNQPFTVAGGGDLVISDVKPGEMAGACGAGGSFGIDTPANVIENGTGSATADAVPAIEQAPAAGCEETVISEFPLPTGGSVKVSVTPC